MQNIQYSTHFSEDKLIDLPFDKSVPTHNETIIINSLFHKKNTVDTIFKHTKDLLLLATIFIIFSLPQVDTLIMKIVQPTQKSLYILIGVKTLLFISLFFIINNIYLVRHNK
jgi:hypothetical protein